MKAGFSWLDFGNWQASVVTLSPLLCFVPVFFRTLFPERQSNYQDPNCTCGLGFRNGAQKTTADAGLAAFKVYEEP